MKNNTNISTSRLFNIAGLAIATVPALVALVALGSLAGAASAFVVSMLAVTMVNDYAPKTTSIYATAKARELNKYPLAA